MKTITPLAISALLVVLGTSPAEPAPPQQEFVGPSFALELDGILVGLLESVDGGSIQAELLTGPGSNSCSTRKRVGPPQFGEITIQFGFSMNSSVYSWISSFLNCNSQRKNGAIIGADFDHHARTRREFSNALITEVSFPSCDAAAKDLGFITLKIRPETISYKPGDGSVVVFDIPPAKKNWKFQRSNYRLTIDGVDAAQVAKIEALTLKQKVVEDPSGNPREGNLRLGRLEVSDLVVTVPDSRAQDFSDWFKSFVLDGMNDESKEKNGSLVFLSTDGQDTLVTLQFTKLVIYRFDPPKFSTGSDALLSDTFGLAIEALASQFPGP